MKITYSAPAKVILSGEHAVVYGKPALVSAINLRLRFHLTNFVRSSKDGNHHKEIFFISNKVKNYLTRKKISYIDKPFNYKIESEIPVGRGLGSSAALSIATATAFLEFYTGRQFDKKEINNLAFQIEKHFHQNPSGVDNSASCFGGLIIYQKSISLKKLNFKIPKDFEDKLLLIDSGKPKETTGEMVKYVSTRSITMIIDKIEVITNKIKDSIEKNNIELFKACLVENEKLLEDLGVVSNKTKKILQELSKFGVGKITGAGGRETNSGFILFLADDKERLEEFLKRKKIYYYQFVPDYQGLQKI